MFIVKYLLTDLHFTYSQQFQLTLSLLYFYSTYAYLRPKYFVLVCVGIYLTNDDLAEVETCRVDTVNLLFLISQLLD
jgi:hypothetical protein